MSGTAFHPEPVDLRGSEYLLRTSKPIPDDKHVQILMPERHAITRAYRQLYRWALRAVQYSAPARFVVKARIRQAFRTGKAEEFDGAKIENTVSFLRSAATTTGVEHHVLRNLLLTWYWEQKFWNDYRRYARPPTYRLSSYDAFDHTIHMLNQSMNMCLPHGNGHMLQRFAKITRKRGPIT